MKTQTVLMWKWLRLCQLRQLLWGVKTLPQWGVSVIRPTYQRLHQGELCRGCVFVCMYITRCLLLAGIHQKNRGFKHNVKTITANRKLINIHQQLFNLKVMWQHDTKVVCVVCRNVVLASYSDIWSKNVSSFYEFPASCAADWPKLINSLYNTVLIKPPLSCFGY